MRVSSRLVAGLLLVSTLAFAGCFGDDPLPAERTVTASGGKTSEGWAYDGVGLAPGSASLEGTLDNVDNTGLVTVSFDLAGSRYVATFDTFAETKPFQDGGIVFELDEHGDTGVADASIPKIHATIAAWGAAKVTKDGMPLVGAAGDAWTAHLMVSRDTVRGTDGKIAKADGTTPYDPASPADARRVENDPQALFFIKHPDGETAKRAPLAGSAPVAISGPNQAATAEVPTEAGASGATINVTVTAGAAPVALGQVAIRILDANGTEIASEPAANVLPNQPIVKSYQVTADKIAGPLTVEVSGSGSYSATVDYVVTFDDHPFIVVTWDEVTVA